MFQAFLIAIMLSIARADFSGDWLMKSATFDGTQIEVPSGEVSLSMSLAPDGYKVFFHAGNRMMGGMIVDDEISDTKAGVHFTPIPSTRMMPPPEFVAVERFITQAIPEMTTATLNDTGNLVLEGPNGGAEFYPSDGEKGDE
jgi:META domain